MSTLHQFWSDHTMTLKWAGRKIENGHSKRADLTHIFPASMQIIFNLQVISERFLNKQVDWNIYKMGNRFIKLGMGGMHSERNGSISTL